MLDMSQINDIRDLKQMGYRNSEIVKKVKADAKTVRKYLKQDDFSPTPPLLKERPSNLDPYKGKIAEWLDEDKKTWKKQSHTAQHVYDRLVEEHKYKGSYNIVQRYMKKVREQAKTRGTLELIWAPGTVQVDFGEADVIKDGKQIRLKFLTASFPYSNNGFSQFFGGETAECVCQGLKDIFKYIGGVPQLAVFDNATGVGRRIGEAIRESELFKRFRSHYVFQVRFCNPDSGHEKGNVEKKVGYNRKNLFVPVPQIDQLATYNQGLLDRHAKKAEEAHYKKGIPIKELFQEDVKALAPLPPKEFDVCRYEWLNADGYGKVCLDGKHHYSTCPENANRKVLVGVRAHWVDILADDGQMIARHDRSYGDARTDVSDYSTSLLMLLRNSGAWQNSGLRIQVPELLRDYMDAQTKESRKNTLRIMDELTGQYGWDAAVKAMEIAAGRGGVNICDAAVLAARITGYGIDTPPEPGPALSVYDQMFLGKEALPS
ncbi:MAG: IS21 family transposase [Clostridiales bacterium]|nr:IS21 family transposase [Clostridiales bacterium]